MPCSATSISTARIRTSRCAFAGRRTRSRSGTTGAPSTSPCGITFRNCARAIGSRSRATSRFDDLTISPGEVVAIVGPSGAGKSTIAALLTRLYDPDSGKILLDRHDLRDLSPSFLRRTIGIVSQEACGEHAHIADSD